MIPRLHVVTDDGVLARDDFLGRAEQVLEAGADVALHLRGPCTTGRRLADLAEALRDVATASGAELLVNDRVDVALCSGLAGVHLGHRSLLPAEARALLGSDRLLGVSVHNMEEALEAVRGDAGFLLVGALWATPSHQDQASVGPNLLHEVATAVSVPLLGIGGVTPERVPTILEAGAHGAAVLGGIWHVPSSGDAVQAYLQALAK